MTEPDSQPTAEDIVRSLARMRRPAGHGYFDGCDFCDRALVSFDGSIVDLDIPSAHGSACPWRQAVEWVRRYPPDNAD